MISRVLGFVRDILIAAALGAGMVADVFFVAFKLPNLFRRLFAEGAFSAAFVPIFTERLTSDGRDAARVFSEQAMAVLVVALLVFIVAMEAAMPVVMMGFAPGFVAIPEKFELLVLLTRITFPYLLFISLVSLMAGVLNALGRFAAAAATPILLNLFLIGYLYWVAFEWIIVSRIPSFAMIQVVRNTMDVLPLAFLLLSVVILNIKFQSTEIKILSAFIGVVFISGISFI